jgi:adenylate cyclase
VQERFQRRLSAIFSSDVVGYSRMMESDEAGTFERLKPIDANSASPSLGSITGAL